MESKLVVVAHNNYLDETGRTIRKQQNCQLEYDKKFYPINDLENPNLDLLISMKTFCTTTPKKFPVLFENIVGLK